MVRNEIGVSRRDVLKMTSATAATVGVAGLASAAPTDTVEVNVGFSSERGRKAALNVADEVLREFAFDAATIQTTKTAADRLRSRPHVRYVEANGQMHALAQTLPWGVDCTDAEKAHECGATGEGLDIAIVDTGIDSDHPDLQANLGHGVAAVTCNSAYGTCNYDWDDDNGHGTHVAGIAGAADNSQGVVGVAPDATLHAVKVLDHAGSGTYSDIAAGIEYVADQGWDVANFSFGGGASSTVKNAVEYAYQNGVRMVGAAGNDGPCTNCVAYPAAYSEVVAVAATDDCSTIASYSSTGPSVEFLAPGTDIYSTYTGGGYDTLTGTSMAAPHVSGAVAVVLGEGYSSPFQRLCNTANGGSTCSCCGVIDVDDAAGC